MAKSVKKQPNGKKEFKSAIPTNKTPKAQYNTLLKKYVEARNVRIEAVSKSMNPTIQF